MLGSYKQDGFTSGLVTMSTAEVFDTLGKVYPQLPSYFYSLPHEGIYNKVNPQQGKYGFFGVNGNKAISAYEYDLAYNFSNCLAPVKKNGKGYINAQKKLAIEFQFDDASAFSEGLAVVKVGKKKGVINTQGQFVVQPRFDTLTDFQHGVAKVTLNNDFFYIRADGKILKE
jgi:hypothetical protein